MTTFAELHMFRQITKRNEALRAEVERLRAVESAVKAWIIDCDECCGAGVYGPEKKSCYMCHELRESLAGRGPFGSLPPSAGNREGDSRG